MNIPEGYAHVAHILGGTALPNGAAVTYGIAPNGGSFDPGDVALLHGFFATHIMNQLTDDVQLLSTIMKYGPNDTGPYVTHAGVTAGSYNTTSAPPNVTYLVRKQTALGGRRNRGRFYLPGVAEAEVNDGGQVISTFRTNLQAKLVLFLNAITGAGMDMVILHNGPGVPTIVASLTADSRVATQRRRLR